MVAFLDRHRSSPARPPGNPLGALPSLPPYPDLDLFSPVSPSPAHTVSPLNQPNCPPAPASTKLPTAQHRAATVVLLKYTSWWAFCSHNPLITTFNFEGKASGLEMSLWAALSGSLSLLWPLLCRSHRPACSTSLSMCPFCALLRVSFPQNSHGFCPACLLKCHIPWGFPLPPFLKWQCPSPNLSSSSFFLLKFLSPYSNLLTFLICCSSCPFYNRSSMKAGILGNGVYLLLYPQGLEQCPPQSSCSVNKYCVNQSKRFLPRMPDEVPTAAQYES